MASRILFYGPIYREIALLIQKKNSTISWITMMEKMFDDLKQ